MGREQGRNGGGVHELTADDEGFRAWAAGRRAWLRRIAYLMCLDWHAADDAVQETLTKVYVRWRSLIRSGSPDAYARRVLITTTVDSRRRPWRRESATEDIARVTSAAGVRTDDEAAARALHEVEASDVRDRVRGALAALPPGMRAAVVLRYYEDLSVEQTAQVLGCSTGTVKSQTSRGLDHLRATLGPVIDDSSPDITGALTGGT